MYVATTLKPLIQQIHATNMQQTCNKHATELNNTIDIGMSKLTINWEIQINNSEVQINNNSDVQINNSNV